MSGSSISAWERHLICGRARRELRDWRARLSGREAASLREIIGTNGQLPCRMVDLEFMVKYELLQCEATNNVKSDVQTLWPYFRSRSPETSPQIL